MSKGTIESDGILGSLIDIDMQKIVWETLMIQRGIVKIEEPQKYK